MQYTTYSDKTKQNKTHAHPKTTQNNHNHSIAHQQNAIKRAHMNNQRETRADHSLERNETKRNDKITTKPNEFDFIPIIIIIIIIVQNQIQTKRRNIHNKILLIVEHVCYVEKVFLYSSSYDDSMLLLLRPKIACATSDGLGIFLLSAV